MLRTGDKIKYVKENSMFGIPLGIVFTVTDIKGVVVALEAEVEIDGMTGVAQCVMSYDEYEKYFEKVVEEPKSAWTEWRKIETDEFNTITHSLNDNYFIIKYLKDYFNNQHLIQKIETRNNGKKTDVRITFRNNNSTRATSTCNITANDKFDEVVGIKVALVKIFAKQTAKMSTHYIQAQY